MQTTRNQRRQLKKDNAKQSGALVEVPRELWPGISYNRTRAFRSNKFLVQEFEEKNAIRLSVNRVVMGSGGRWEENITWDDLQDIKREVGHGDKFAIEIYPEDGNIVNVANMRHLWILDKRLDMGWINS